MAHIWCTTRDSGPIAELLTEGTAGHLVVFAPRTEVEKDAEVIFGQPEVDALEQCSRLRWVHLESAGYERFDSPEVFDRLKQRGIILTTSSRVYDEPCAEHALAMVLAFARGLPVSLEAQLGERTWHHLEIRAGLPRLDGSHALLLGFGAIAHRLVELLAPLRMKVKAVRRRVTGEEPVPVFSYSDLPRLLGEADHVIDLLPSNASTRGFMNGERFSAMKQGAVFYNIGRGTTVDQPALLEALRSGHLGGAYLDVTDPEPLPPDHPLWSAPNCYITPHSSGGHQNESLRLTKHFVANLRRFDKGEPLIDRII
jgi:phosphoglycerate dehydrogenase-like enzyme